MHLNRAENLLDPTQKDEQLSKAEQEIYRAIQLDPRNDLAYRLLGLIAKEREDFPLAVSSLSTAIELYSAGSDVQDEHLAELYCHRAECLVAQARHGDPAGPSFLAEARSDLARVRRLIERLPRLHPDVKDYDSRRMERDKLKASLENWSGRALFAQAILNPNAIDHRLLSEAWNAFHAAESLSALDKEDLWMADKMKKMSKAKLEEFQYTFKEDGTPIPPEWLRSSPASHTTSNGE